MISNVPSNGRGRDLYRFAALAYGVAVLEYAISPEHLVSWALGHQNFADPFSLIAIIGTVWWPSTIALTIIWLVTVVMGFRKCGGPAILLLVSIPWGLKSLMSLDLLDASCFFLHECL